MQMLQRCPKCGSLDLDEYDDYGVVYMKCRHCGWDERGETYGK